MTVIADLTVPAEQFPLGDLLEVREGVQIRLESMIPTGDVVIPYFWVGSEDAEAIESALRDSPVVAESHVVDEVSGETLFRVDWTQDIDGVITAITDADAVVLDGAGRGDHWSFRIQFPDHEDLTTFHRMITDREIPIEVEGIHTSAVEPDEAAFGLSPEQREALLLALQEGYFAVPREITLVELAEELGISDSAVSQRIRRGVEKVLTGTLTSDAPQA